MQYNRKWIQDLLYPTAQVIFFSEENRKEYPDKIQHPSIIHDSDGDTDIKHIPRE